MFEFIIFKDKNSVKIFLKKVASKQVTRPFGLPLVILLGLLKSKNFKKNKKTVLLTYECAKKICMMSKSKKADVIRKYFIELDKSIIKYCVKI